MKSEIIHPVRSCMETRRKESLAVSHRYIYEKKHLHETSHRPQIGYYMIQSKKDKIKKTLKETKKRRSSLQLKVYTLKVDKSHLSNKKLCYLNLLFTEAKWLYNHILALDKELWDFDTKIKTVITLDKDKNPVEKPLIVLSAQMRQSVFEQLKENIYTLNKLKKQGFKVGKLKFKSAINCIKLKQVGVTYRLEKNYFSLQGFKKRFKVNGCDQLKNVVEIGEAKLVRRAGDYYLKVTCYVEPTVRKKTNKTVGVDFGIKTTLVTSDNDKINIQIPETSRLKKLSRGMNKKVKGSKNRFKQKILLQKEYENINRKKKDIVNKVVRDIVERYDRIFIQDENVKGWKNGWFGRQVQHSTIGGIIAELKKHPATSVVDRWFPSTKLCEVCGKLNAVGLDERTYHCPYCGHSEDRDLHSAKNIKCKGLHPLWCVPDINTSVELKPLPSVVVDNSSQVLTLKQEAIAFRAW